MYILTTLEFPKHNFDYYLKTVTLTAFRVIFIAVQICQQILATSFEHTRSLGRNVFFLLLIIRISF